LGDRVRDDGEIDSEREDYDRLTPLSEYLADVKARAGGAAYRPRTMYLCP
jgi:hypothetical protein